MIVDVSRLTRQTIARCCSGGDQPDGRSQDPAPGAGLHQPFFPSDFGRSSSAVGFAIAAAEHGQHPAATDCLFNSKLSEDLHLGDRQATAPRRRCRAVALCCVLTKPLKAHPLFLTRLASAEEGHHGAHDVDGPRVLPHDHHLRAGQAPLRQAADGVRGM